jgi:hypothetical protein
MQSVPKQTRIYEAPMGSDSDRHDELERGAGRSFASIEPIAYTIRGAVTVSGFSRSRIYEMIARGELKARKDGRKTLVLAESLVACIQALPPLKPTKQTKPALPRTDRD